MTKKNGSRKGVGDVVREQMGVMKGVGFTQDPEFDASSQEFGPFGPMKTTGEIIRDRLIESCRGADGWYITLDKDIGGNEWQFKEKITSYDHWTNLTVEINEWVRQKTKIENDRTGMVRNYGSGRYRVMFHNVNGNRGDQQPIVIPVDAQEFMLETPKGPLASTAGSDVTEILRTVQATSMKPEDVVKAQVDAVNKGMELALQREDKKASSENTMMTAMFGMLGTMMAAIVGKPAPTEAKDPMAMMNQFFDMAKNMGAFKDQSAPPKSLADTIAELKAVGIKVGENDDPFAVLSKVKNMVGLFRDLTGSGGDGEISRPSMTEMLIDKIEPQAITTLVKMLALKGADNTVKPNIMPRQAAPQRIAPSPSPREVQSAPAAEPEQQYIEEEQAPVSQEQVSEPEISAEDAEMFGLITKFTRELKDAVINDRTDKFPYITETISKYTDQADFNIKIGQVTTDVIVAQIMTLDSKTYVDPAMKQKLIDYVNRYIEYVRSQGPYYAKCSKCHNFASYLNKSVYEAETDKICEGMDDTTCGGILQPVY